MAYTGRLAAGTLAIAIMGCAGPLAAQAKFDTSGKLVRNTPFLHLTKQPSGGQPIKGDFYTRLIIEADYPAEEDVLGYAKRDPLSRLFIGKKYSFTTVLRSNIGRYTGTVPLYNRDYESSNKAGEKFSRATNFDRGGFPWVLVSSGRGTRTANFNVTVNMAEVTSPDASGIGLGYLEAALKAVAPGSSLVTNLTKDSLDRVASKMDEQIGKLFGTSAAEDISFDIDLDTGASYTLSLNGPWTETDSIMSGRGPMPKLGTWTITVAPPRPSMFSWRMCSKGTDCEQDKELAYKDAMKSPAAALKFLLVDNVGAVGKVESFLSQQSWWAKSLQTLSGSQATAKDYAQFCRQVRGALVEVGMNDLDGRIVASALVHSDHLPIAARDAMVDAKSPDCGYGNS